MTRIEPNRKTESLSGVSIDREDLRKELARGIGSLINYAIKFSYIGDSAEFARVRTKEIRGIKYLFERNEGYMEIIYEGAIRRILQGGEIEKLRGLEEVVRISGKDIDTRLFFSREGMVEFIKGSALKALFGPRGAYRASLIWSYLPEDTHLSTKEEIVTFARGLIKNLDSASGLFYMGRILSLGAFLDDKDRERIFGSNVTISAFKRGVIKLFDVLDDDNYQRTMAAYARNKDKIPEQFLAALKSKEVTDGLEASIMRFISSKQGVGNYLKNNLRLLASGIIANPKEVIASSGIKKAWSNAVIAQITDVGSRVRYGKPRYSLLEMAQIPDLKSSLLTDSPEMMDALKAATIDALNCGDIKRAGSIIDVIGEIWGSEKQKGLIQNEVPDSVWINTFDKYLSNDKANKDSIIECLNFVSSKIGIYRAFDILTTSALTDRVKTCLCKYDNIFKPDTFGKFIETFERNFGQDILKQFLATESMKEWFLFAAKKTLSSQSPVTIVSLLECVEGHVDMQELAYLFISDKEYFQGLSDYMMTKPYPRPKLKEFYGFLLANS